MQLIRKVPTKSKDEMISRGTQIKRQTLSVPDKNKVMRDYHFSMKRTKGD
jgi:hypothetical protein